MHRKAIGERASLAMVDAGAAGDLRFAAGTVPSTTAPGTERQQRGGVARRALAATCLRSSRASPVAPGWPLRGSVRSGHRSFDCAYIQISWSDCKQVVRDRARLRRVIEVGTPGATACVSPGQRFGGSAGGSAVSPRGLLACRAPQGCRMQRTAAGPHVAEACRRLRTGLGPRLVHGFAPGGSTRRRSAAGAEWMRRAPGSQGAPRCLRCRVVRRQGPSDSLFVTRS